MKSNYHHGNLKQVLLVEAEKILVSKGIKGLTLRSLAKSAGVSATAPYNHFSSKNALLEALATEGFVQLRQYIDKSLETNKHLLDTEKIALGYINYALEHAQLFRLMFGSALAEVPPSKARIEAGRLSYEPIRRAVTGALQQRNTQQLDPESATQGAWALVHGVATLVNDGKMRLAEEPSERTDQLISIVRAFSLGVYGKA